MVKLTNFALPFNLRAVKILTSHVRDLLEPVRHGVGYDWIWQVRQCPSDIAVERNFPP